MKLLPEMLAEYVETSLSPEEIGDLLTMVGFELEEILEGEGEPVLDVNIMANRGDAASVLGLAREVQAKVGGATERVVNTMDLSWSDESDRIQIASPLCVRFALLDIGDAQNGESPEWLQKRLRRMGQRPISLLVDLTNYVMLEVGQPLHAYDADRLQTGRFTVREAAAGEMLRTLDGVEREMRGGELLITEGEGSGRPVGLAGIMGGEATEVHPGTKRAVIEAANFDAQSVRATRKAHGLFTEASYRFERGVDPLLSTLSFRRFAELYNSITGARLDPEEHDGVGLPEDDGAPICVRPARASQLLGYSVDRGTCASILQRLGFASTSEPKSLTGVQEEEVICVSAPSWRFDIVREEDLVEEIGRVNGYDKIPALLPQGTTQPGGLRGRDLWREQTRAALIAEGFTQIMGHSLVAGGALMDPEAREIGPRVVASPEHRVLRSSLWVSLAMAARRNGGQDLHLFEMGRVFDSRRHSSECEKIALLSTGELNPPGLKSHLGERADFFSLKGALERVADKMAFGPLEFRTFELDPRLHPTRQATVMDWDGQEMGVIGQIHPDVAKAEGLPPNTFLAEIESDWYGRKAVKSGLSRHPAIRRDLAIVVKRDVPYFDLEQAIQKSAGDLLEKQWVFDVYEGPNVGEGMKSIGVAIVLRKPDGTFTDEEANRVRDEIARALEPLGATLRVG